MSIIYWTYYNSGKGHLKTSCRGNNKSVIIYNQQGFVRFTYTDDDREVITQYYTENDKLVKNIVKTSQGRSKDIRARSYTWPGEYYNYVDPHLKEPRKRHIDNPVSTMLFTHDQGYMRNAFQHPDWEDEYLPIFAETDVLFAPYILLGADRIGNFMDGNIRPVSQRCMEFVKSCKSILPYKEDLVDSMISKLACFDKLKMARKSLQRKGKPVIYRDLFDAFKKDKEIVYLHLDDILRQSRKTEYTLRQLGIPYEYFNLDKDSYAEVFGMTYNEVPRDHTHPTWDLNDEETYKNWCKVRDIAVQYIEDTNLKDWRLP